MSTGAGMERLQALELIEIVGRVVGTRMAVEDGAPRSGVAATLDDIASRLNDVIRALDAAPPESTEP